MKTHLLIALLLCGFLGISQTIVSGTVVDQNNEPVPAANVVIAGKAIGTTADFDGLFKLETSEVPPFQLRITSIGYSDATQDVTENNQTFNIVMNESSTVLDEIIVSASRRREKVQEAPASVSVLSARKLDATPNATDVTRSLINVPGGSWCRFCPLRPRGNPRGSSFYF